MSKPVSARSKNSLIVGLRDNFADGAKERSLSPALGLRPKEAIELVDMNGGGGGDSNFEPDTKTRQSNTSKFSIDLSDNDSNGNITGSIPSSAGSSRKGKGPRGPGSGKRSVGLGYQDEGIELHSSLGSEFSDMSRASRKSGSSSCTSSLDGELEFFCVDHMQLCSNKNAKKHHEDCSNVVPAYEWAEAQRMERDRKNTEARLIRFDTFAGIMIEERGKMKKKLTESKDVVTEDFLDMMEDLIAHLLTKQREFIAKLDEIHESNLKQISDQIKRCKMVQKEAGASLQQLSDCPPESHEYNKMHKKVQEKCPVYEEILRRDFNGALRMDYEFVPDPSTETIFQRLVSLGNVVVRRKPVKLPGFLSTPSEADYSKRALAEISHNEGISEIDVQSCGFNGCAYISGGRMVLTDWNNSCVKMFNNRGLLIHRLNLPNNPWDVKKIDDSTIVVTLPGEQMIVILEYSKTELDLVLSFDTGCECWGVAPVGDKFATTCDPWSKTPSVKVFSNKGKLLSFFQKDENGHMLFTYPEHIAVDRDQTTLYISDSRADTVLAITLEGVVTFRYTHPKLAYPTGLDTDNQGHVYVCGRDSKNVHQVSKDGQFVRTLLDSSHVTAPRALCFEPAGEMLMLTDTSTETCDEFITTHFN